MKSIRMLIVEDEADLLALLKKTYREVFIAQGYTSITIETASTVEEARDLARQAQAHPYDLVSLDVNLGDADLSGLDVLASLKRFQSAWMVSLLTGVETDASIDTIMGAEEGERLRKSLRSAAYRKFPAERLLVVEKPSRFLPQEEAQSLLQNRIEQIALVFGEVGRLRYIFRPLEVVSLERVKATKEQKNKKGARKFIETTSLHWQIRFDCGDIRTLPDKAGFKTLHRILSMDRGESLTPEAALVVEPKNEKPGQSVIAAADEAEDPLKDYFVSKGIPWSGMEKEAQENLIRVALSHRFKRYVELRDLKDEDDLAPSEEDELNVIIKELGPLAAIAEIGYLRMAGEVEPSQDMPPISIEEMGQAGLVPNGGGYVREEGRRGEDAPSAEAFRARMMRVRDCLRENGFAPFAQHLEAFLSSSGANWSYHPPSGVEWTVS